MKVFLIADIHGSAEPIKNFYEATGESGVMIILGDAGLNYYLNKKDQKLKAELGNYPFTYFVIRGNHEQRPEIVMSKKPESWYYECAFDGRVMVEKEFPYIKYALDICDIYTFNGKRCLALPGAYSIDKYYRLQQGRQWFPQEQMSEDERKTCLKLYSNKKFDYILAHTCPIGVEAFISDLFLGQVNQADIDHSTEAFIEELISTIDYDRYYFGHYHDNRNVEPYKATMVYHNVIELGQKAGGYEI